MERDPQHPIIERPYEYAIADFRYHMGLDGSEPFLDLTLVRGDTTRRLRFLAPQNLRIDGGFPSPTGGMVILDVRGRRLDGLGVEVADHEASHGGITFYARDVVDLGTTATDVAESPGLEQRRKVPWWCLPWLRVLTCLVALVLAWWPITVWLHIVALSRIVPAASIAAGYALPFMIVSWLLGMCVAVFRRGDPASATSERVVLALAALPLPLFVLLVLAIQYL